MQKFCFKLSKTEEQFRHNIDTAMMYDKPEIFLFFKNYGKGLSFTKNDEIISGVYLQNSDKSEDSLHNGVSIRARFRGKIISNDDGCFFTGWIYPDPIGLAVVIYTFLMFLILSEAMFPKLFAAGATAFFLHGYMTLISKCVKELSFIATGE